MTLTEKTKIHAERHFNYLDKYISHKYVNMNHICLYTGTTNVLKYIVHTIARVCQFHGNMPNLLQTPLDQEVPWCTYHPPIHHPFWAFKGRIRPGGVGVSFARKGTVQVPEDVLVAGVPKGAPKIAKLGLFIQFTRVTMVNNG